MIELEQQETKSSVPMASIKVIGVGGAGGNTVNNIIDVCHQSIEFIVANTDAQALENSHAEKKIQLGVKSTRGLGTGADPELGKRAAEEDIDKVMEEVKDADIVFLTAGMGGGTGSGALPVIAHALKEKGILSIAIVTKPFTFEGKKRSKIADDAVLQLKKEVDTLIIIPNQKLLDVADRKMSMPDAFALINDLFAQSIKGIADIITKSGYINVDFADVRNIMKSQGLAVMGTASATGDNRAQEAALKAVSSPLLENMSIAGAHGVLLNITGGPSLGLQEISAAANVVYDQVDDNAQIIIGSVIDNDMQDDVSVTIIATGFECAVPDVSPLDPALVAGYERAKAEKSVTPSVSTSFSEPQETGHPECVAQDKTYQRTDQAISVQPTYIKAAVKTPVEAVSVPAPTVKPIQLEQTQVQVQPVAKEKAVCVQEKAEPIPLKKDEPKVQPAKIEEKKKESEKDLMELSEEDEDAQIRALLAADERKEKEKQEAAARAEVAKQDEKVSIEAEAQDLVVQSKEEKGQAVENDLDVPTFLREKEQESSSSSTSSS